MVQEGDSRDIMRNQAQATQRDRGFTLVEVIIALVILGIGVIALLRLFPTGVQRAAEAERITRATLLAQEILEGIKAQGGAGLVTPVPGPTNLAGAILEPIPMPGDGIDNDEDGYLPTGDVHPFVDINGNGQIDGDYDGLPEQDYAGRLCRDGFFCIESNVADGIDNDLDGVVDDDGDSNACRYSRPVLQEGLDVPQLPDGDFNYDPEMNYVGGFLRGADEEYPDGTDNDPDVTDGIDINGDGTVDISVDEDVRLASNYRDGLWFPLEPGDNVDNDGDGEEDSPRDPDGYAVADGLDNNGNGLIDEGIDEEVFNGLDDDGDGVVDEDCRASSYPFTTRKFFRARYVDDDGDALTDEDPNNSRDDDGDGLTDEDPPNDSTDQFSWQIIVGRVPDGGGDGINNDGDSFSGIEKIDEELRDGLNDDPQCGDETTGFDLLVDEDCMAAPVRGFRRVTVRVTWNGDGDRNQDGYPGEFGVDDDNDGRMDFEDPEVEAAMAFEAAILGIPGDPRDSWILRERWAQDDDEDGRIDEEKLNGLDDDLDGRIDEDVSTAEFNLTGFVQL
jgi:prepilin-type N-terminal cleavage/methylation domain-containing protein